MHLYQAAQIAVIVQDTETGQSLTYGWNPSPFAYLGKSTETCDKMLR